MTVFNATTFIPILGLTTRVGLIITMEFILYLKHQVELFLALQYLNGADISTIKPSDCIKECLAYSRYDGRSLYILNLNKKSVGSLAQKIRKNIQRYKVFKNYKNLPIKSGIISFVPNIISIGISSVIDYINMLSYGNYLAEEVKNITRYQSIKNSLL